MRPVNLFLTEDGVLKLGYYGLTTPTECYSIKEMECEGLRSFAPEVFEGKCYLDSDIWSFGIALLEMMGITPYSWCKNNSLPTMGRSTTLPFGDDAIESSELVDFLKKCLTDVDDRWRVDELLDVSGMGWRMTSSIPL